MRIDLVGVDLVRIDLVAPNPQFDMPEVFHKPVASEAI